MPQLPAGVLYGVPALLAGVALLPVGWLVAARDVWRLARLP